nr:unnamed protein product [Callosobruchus chinensis]
MECSLLDKTYPKPTMSDYQMQMLDQTKLFDKVMTQDRSGRIIDLEASCSMLVTGFGMRNLESLQECLEREENKRLLILYKQQQEQAARDAASHLTISSSTTSSSTRGSRTIETETELSTVKSDLSGQKIQLEYLMGLQAGGEEYFGTEVEKREDEEQEETADFIYSTSVSMKNAQKYLRVHRIFDFFQFIIAHLVQATPEDPITFILELLNKCLIFRSGRGKPPLLYQKNHIAELFNLMDRMKSGVIEVKQYHQGMTTLGICEYEKSPSLNQDGMVDREVFIEEVYDAELDLFNDLIKKKWVGKRPKRVQENVVDTDDMSKSTDGPYFIPSDLLKTNKSQDVASEGQE